MQTSTHEPAKPRRRRDKQQRFKGMEPIKDKALREAAEKLKGIRDERMRIQRDEQAAQDLVIHLMTDRKETAIELSGGLEVTLITGKTKARVKIGDDESEDEDE